MATNTKMRLMSASKKAKMRLMMDLPSEILMEIFKRLPVKSVYRLRCVSKTFLDLIDSRIFVLLHSRSAVAEEPLHLLRLNSSYCATTHTSFTALQSLNYVAGQGKLSSSDILSAFKRCNLHFVFNNLFCWEIVVEAGQDVLCFLIDPSREEVLRLPIREKKSKNARRYYGMGFDNITNTYKIVILSQHSKSKTCLGGKVHVVGTSSWHEIPASSVTLSLNQCLYPDSTLCAYGDMHWFFREIHEAVIHMISFDFTKEEFFSTPLPAALSREYPLKCVTLKGSIAAVKVDPTTAIEIWVMKDYNTKEWTREYNINLQSLGRDLKPMLHHPIHRAFYAGWENGVVFIRHDTYLRSGTCLFFDLRHDPVSYVICQIEGRTSNVEKTWSCKRSLMSLKEMVKQVEEPEANILSMLEFSRKYLPTPEPT